MEEGRSGPDSGSKRGSRTVDLARGITVRRRVTARLLDCEVGACLEERPFFTVVASSSSDSEAEESSSLASSSEESERRRVFRLAEDPSAWRDLPSSTTAVATTLLSRNSRSLFRSASSFASASSLLSPSLLRFRLVPLPLLASSSCSLAKDPNEAFLSRRSTASSSSDSSTSCVLSASKVASSLSKILVRRWSCLNQSRTSHCHPQLYSKPKARKLRLHQKISLRNYRSASPFRCVLQLWRVPLWG